MKENGLSFLTEEDIANNLALFDNSILSICTLSPDYYPITFIKADRELFIRSLQVPFLEKMTNSYIFDSKFGICARYAGQRRLNRMSPNVDSDLIWLENGKVQKDLHELLSPEEIQKKYNLFSENTDLKLKERPFFGNTFSIKRHNFLDIFLQRFPNMSYHMDILQKVEFK